MAMKATVWWKQKEIVFLFVLIALVVLQKVGARLPAPYTTIVVDVSMAGIACLWVAIVVWRLFQERKGKDVS